MKIKVILTLSGRMKAVTSVSHKQISIFDRNRRIICSAHMGTICSLMHIDAGIKAKQAGRQTGITLTIPPTALPPCSHLFVPVLKHEYQTCPADRPLNTQQWLTVIPKVWLHFLHPPLILPTFVLASGGPSCVQLQCCVLISKSMEPAGCEAQRGRRLTILFFFILNTNTDCFLEEAVCCHSVSLRNILLHTVSVLLFSLPQTGTSCPHALLLFSSSSSYSTEGQVWMQQFCYCCKRASRIQQAVGTHLWVTLTAFSFLCLPHGCRRVPERWRIKENYSLAHVILYLVELYMLLCVWNASALHTISKSHMKKCRVEFDRWREVKSRKCRTSNQRCQNVVNIVSEAYYLCTRVHNYV